MGPIAYLCLTRHFLQSHNAIIVEIARDCPDIEKALGSHNWSEMLKNPNPNEKEQQSKVFHCRYNKGRDVQKNGACVTHLIKALAQSHYRLGLGWKRIDVEERWFRDFNPKSDQ